MRIGLTLLLIMSYPAGVLAESDPEPPSAALLEFLGELEPMDEETWQILEHHALRDVPSHKEVSNE